jgi:hypothetical protein
MPSLRERAVTAIASLRSRPEAGAIKDGLELLKPLRDARDFGRLGDLSEALSRLVPENALVRAYYAQSLIDTGRATAALDVLHSALRLPGLAVDTGDELWGLIGRANKQIYIDSVDRTAEAVRAAINAAVQGYDVPFKRSSSRVWHAINLAAVLHAARRGGVELEASKGLDGAIIARGILVQLDNSKQTDRDGWWSATKAEAHVALGEWAEAEAAIRNYVNDPSIPVFYIASTLRQLREVWEIHRDGPEGAGLLQLLEARLASLADSTLELSPEHVRLMRAQDEPTQAQTERVLGNTDAQPIRWYRNALDCAASVAAVRMRFGARFGTAFAVAAADFGLATDETLVLTNFHVVNREGVAKAEKPGSVEIAFEAAAQSGLGPYPVAEVVAESPLQGGLDYALLRLAAGSELPAPLRITRDLPSLDGRARVGVIGHPNQNEIQLALQDNHLLEHEGPPNGTPPVARRVRVHYHTPTSKGSSGSPVFDETWQVIALHHAGSKFDPLASELGLSRLNGNPELYSANEGIWIGSIADDVAAQLAQRRPTSP